MNFPNIIITAVGTTPSALMGPDVLLGYKQKSIGFVIFLSFFFKMALFGTMSQTVVEKKYVQKNNLVL